MHTEKWKKCCGGYFAISNRGRLKCIHHYGKSFRCHKIGLVAQQGHSKSYRRVYINNECYLIHRLVAEAFIGPCPKGKEVNHKDLNKVNNYYKNLEYKTHRDNLIHAVRKGVTFNPHPKRGEDSPLAKLTNDQRDIIKKLYLRYIKGKFANNRKITLGSLARKFKVSRPLIEKIVYGCDR